MLIPENYPRLIRNRHDPMPDQSEAWKDIRGMRSKKAWSNKKLKEAFKILNRDAISVLYPEYKKEIMKVCREGKITLYMFKGRKYYDRGEIEAFIKFTQNFASDS